MDALTPTRRFFGPCGHERRSVPGGSPCLSRPHFQPFRPQPPNRLPPDISVRSPFLSVRKGRPFDPATARSQRESFPLGFGSGLRTAVAGSPVGMAESGSRCVMGFMSRCYGPVVHLRQLSTPCRHDAVAFGYRRVNVPPGRDSRPAVCTPSQAHERGRPRPRQVRPGNSDPLRTKTSAARTPWGSVRIRPLALAGQVRP